MSKKPKRTAAPRHTTQPRDIDRWLNRAAQQLVAASYPGVIATARRVLRASIASRKQRAEAYDRLGAAYMLLQQHEDAYAMVTAAVALTPDNPLLWYNRGLTARYTTRFGQSLRDLERAKALDGAGLLADQLAGGAAVRPLVGRGRAGPAWPRLHVRPADRAGGAVPAGGAGDGAGTLG